MEIKNLQKGLVLLLASMLTACSDDETSRIVIGTGQLLLSPNNVQYQLPFVVQASDVSGGPAAGVSVSLTVRPTQYTKGQYIATDINGDLNPDEWVATASAVCPTEDTNQNGILDSGEDTNGNGVLDPASSATIASHPDEVPTLTPGTNQVVTDSDGFGYFVLAYPKSEGNWSRVALTASFTSDSGSETQTNNYTLLVILDDLQDVSIIPPGGVQSPYGVGAICSNPA